ncbi:MAG: peptidylprolyl isomerase [Deltaproteobacteria bacterium]|nr:peptidylprolyl isomerase [Deltaproteobacteria bacterium]
MASRARERPTPPSGRRPIVLLVLGAAAGALAAAAGLTAPSATRLPAGVIALVNQQPIREEDYARALDAVAADRRGPLREEDRQHVLDRLVEEELLVQRGLELGLARDDRRVRADLTQTVIDGIVSQTADREPTDAELQAFYDQQRDFFAGPGRLQVRQVFVRVTAASDPAALARAAQAAQRLRAGEDLAAVQAALGDPPLSPLPDTALPPAKLRDYLGPTALRAALELEPGEVSDPVRSGTGYHVLQLVDRQREAAPELADIRDQVANEWRRRSGEQALRQYLDELRASSTVVLPERLP